MPHFLDLSLLSRQDAQTLLTGAATFKAQRADVSVKGTVDPKPLLPDHTLALIFEQPSTRTRLSFDMAIRQMGGSSLVLNRSDMQLGRGETIADTARVLSRMVDVVMLRTGSHDILQDLATFSECPVINGLTDQSHPCQIMADLLTVQECLGSVSGTTMAWVGDGNNMCHSLIDACALFDFTLHIAHPVGYAPDTDRVTSARQHGGHVVVMQSISDAVRSADVVMTDKWVSMADTDQDQRYRAFESYQVTPEVMEHAASHAIFLHCLPAQRGQEVSGGVIDGPQSRVWQQAENRLHAQKAILAWCFNRL